MRALILSDIHANLEALTAVIDAAPEYDCVWNLGDVVGYGANPNEVIDRVRQMGDIFVRGNHDRACSGLTDAEGFNPIAGRAARWTRAVLTEEHTEWLRQMRHGPIYPEGYGPEGYGSAGYGSAGSGPESYGPEGDEPNGHKPAGREPDRHASAIRSPEARSLEIHAAEGRSAAKESSALSRPGRDQISCSHGSLVNEDQYLLTARDAAGPLGESACALNFFGHTHVQGGFAKNGREWLRITPQYSSRETLDCYKLVLKPGYRYMLNPGSVGQPRDGNWRAAFALYDDASRTVFFYRVPYDVRLAQMRIVAAGLPDRLATRLREGR